MEKRIQKITIFLFCAIQLLLFVGFFLVEDGKFSDNENRYLTQNPTFTVKSLFSGKYTSQLEEYIVDQFPLRELWIQAKAMINYGTLKLENNQIYFGEEGYLMSQLLIVDESAFQKNISRMKDFELANPELEFSWLIVPTVSHVGKDHLPSGAVNIDQQDYLLQIEEIAEGWVDLSQLNQADYFYKTDHHWNEQGAYVGYFSFMTQQDMNPNEFNFQEVSNSFKGTSLSRSGAYWYSTDEIYKIETEEKSVTITFEDGKKYDTLYFEEWLNKKDQYAYYLDGNHPVVWISSEEESQDKETLLIIKDSYAHIFVPYLTSHYNEIVLLDLRYYNGSVSEFLKTKEIDHILYLYGIETLMEEKNFVFLK